MKLTLFLLAFSIGIGIGLASTTTIDVSTLFDVHCSTFPPKNTDNVRWVAPFGKGDSKNFEPDWGANLYYVCGEGGYRKWVRRKPNLKYYPLCDSVDDFTPCQEFDGKSWTFYSGGKKHPSLKPKSVKIEWGPCTEWDYENAKFNKFDCSYAALTKNTSVYNFLTIDVHCTRQIGYGSDGKVYWRDPRKEKK